MKIKTLVGRFFTLTAVSSLALMYSCKKDDATNGQDSLDAISESLIDAYYEDADDITITAAQSISSARVATDDRLCTAPTASGNQDAGTIVFDFGATGCTDPRGNVRKGKITVEYFGGPVGETDFTLQETFSGYSINGITLQGTRTIVRKESTGSVISHAIDLAGGKATWPDGTYETRSSSFTRDLDANAGIITLEGEAQGTNRNGRDYGMIITKPLVYKQSCVDINKIYMAVEGTKTFTTERGELLIDFGTGECDRTITLTANKVTFTLTVNK